MRNLEQDRGLATLEEAPTKQAVLKYSSLTYSSDTIIRDPITLGPLCVFFDNIYLPYLPEEHAGRLLRVHECGHMDVVDLQFEDDYVRTWDESHAALFDAGVLRRLPPWNQTVEFDPDRLKDVSPNISGFSRRAYFVTRVIHHFRRDQYAPHIIDTTRQSPTRTGFNWLLAQEAFSYLVPSLYALPVDQILEVREKVAYTREGFVMHLQKLSRDVEQRTIAGEPFESVQQHARSVIETELVPDYLEFRRQLTARQAGSWGRVLDLAGKSISLLIAVTRFEFAATGFSALSDIMAMTADRRNAKNTNVRMAYQFLRRLSSEVPAKTQVRSTNADW